MPDSMDDVPTVHEQLKAARDEIAGLRNRRAARVGFHAASVGPLVELKATADEVRISGKLSASDAEAYAMVIMIAAAEARENGGK
jgi:hypothetical protein